MNFKTMALNATLAGTVMASGIVMYTGTDGLNSIKNTVMEWANKISTSVDNSTAMLDKFNIFKSGTQDLINEKIAKINELQAKIGELNGQVASGEMDLGQANDLIADLYAQIEQANTEIADLQSQINAKEIEVNEKYAEMVTADDMDITLTLDEQTGTPAPTEPTEQTEQTEQTETVDYTAQALSIQNALKSKLPNQLESVTVTMTENTISLTEDNINDIDTVIIKQEINKIIGKVPTGPTKNGNTHTYTY